MIKDGAFRPSSTATSGRYTTDNYPDDGTTVNVNGGWGIPLGRGSLGVFGEFRDRQPTNRAWADPFEAAGTGVADSINDIGQVIHKSNPVPQPNHHWGDGLEKDALALCQLPHAAQRGGQQRDLQLRRVQPPQRHRQSLPALLRQRPQLARDLPAGLPAHDRRPGHRLLDGGWASGLVSGWSYDLGAQFGHNGFDYEIGNTLNASLGPCLDVACAPGPDGVLGTGDDPGIPNQLSFFAGRVLREELVTGLNVAKPVEMGLPEPVNLAFGATFRRERYAIRAGELASYINGVALDQGGADLAPGGSQSFPGLRAGRRNRSPPHQLRPLRRRGDQPVGTGPHRGGAAVRELQRLRKQGERQALRALPALPAGDLPRRGRAPASARRA